jgi:hypothetical protein
MIQVFWNIVMVEKGILVVASFRAMKAYRGSRAISPPILDLGAR